MGCFLGYRVVSNKESFVYDCYEVWDGKVVWGVSFRRALRLCEEAHQREFVSFLSQHVYLLV